MSKQDKVICHFFGGAGISISEKCFTPYLEAGAGYCDLEFNYLDSSENNYNALKEPYGDLHLLEPVEVDGDKISGSGGDRGSNAGAIVTFVNKYMKEKRYKSNVTGVHHIVVASASGGTGSIGGPLLLTALRKQGITAIIILVGDDHDAIGCRNTHATIAYLDHISKKVLNEPICLLYMNNNAHDGERIDGITAVDKYIRKVVGGLMVFLSGSNEDLDSHDMVTMLTHGNYTTIDIKPGLYGLRLYSGKDALLTSGLKCVVVRTLLSPDEREYASIRVAHHKVGTVTDHEALTSMAGMWPLHLVSHPNYMVEEYHHLTELNREYKEDLNSSLSDDMGGDHNISEDGLMI